MKFNYNQIKQLAEFCANFSLIFFGTVITPTFVKVDKVNPLMLVLDITLVTGFLVVSMLLLRGVIDES